MDLAQLQLLEQGNPSAWLEEEEDDVEEFTQEEIDNEPKKCILWASEHGKLDKVSQLLASDPNLVGSVDGDLYTPLHRASYNNHGQVAKTLVSHGANIHAQTEDGWTPLHSAARWNSVDTATILLASGADVNARTNGGLTPLHLAASDPENGPMLALLLSCPFVDVSIKGGSGETARTLCERHSPHYKLFDLVADNVNQLLPSS